MTTTVSGKYSKFLLFIAGGIFCGIISVVLGDKFSLKLIISLIIGMGVAVAIMINPRIGFLMTSAFVSLERFGRFTADSSIFTISLMRIIGLFTLMGLILHYKVSNERMKIGTEFLIYIAYSFFCFFSIFYSSDPRGAIRAFGQIIANLIFFYTVINCVRTFSIAKISIAICLVVTAFIGLYTVYDWNFGTLRATDDTIGLHAYRWSTVWLDGSEWKAGFSNVMRAIGSTSHAAVYGINLILTIPFFFFFHRTGKPFIKVLSLSGLGLVLYNVLLTNTRAVLLVAIITLFFSYVMKLWKIKLPTLILLFVITFSALIFAKGDSFKRILDVNNYSMKKAHALQIRTNYWKAGLKLISNKWMLGVGLGNKLEIPKYINDLVPDQTTVHNEFIQTAMDVGIFGWIVHFSFIFLILYKSFKSARIIILTDKKNDEYYFLLACQISMMVTLIYGLQADVFHFPLKLWWLIAGITITMYDLTIIKMKNSDPELLLKLTDENEPLIAG